MKALRYILVILALCYAGASFAEDSSCNSNPKDPDFPNARAGFHKFRTLN